MSGESSGRPSDEPPWVAATRRAHGVDATSKMTLRTLVKPGYTRIVLEFTSCHGSSTGKEQQKKTKAKSEKAVERDRRKLERLFAKHQIATAASGPSDVVAQGELPAEGKADASYKRRGQSDAQPASYPPFRQVIKRGRT